MIKFTINNNDIKLVKKSEKSKDQKSFKFKKLSKNRSLSKNNTLKIFSFLIFYTKMAFNHL